MTIDQSREPDFTEPTLQIDALIAIHGIMRQLEAAAAAVAPHEHEGEPDPPAVRTALTRASVLLATLIRWAGVPR